MSEVSRYTQAGVDIAAGDRVKKSIAECIRGTLSDRVLNREGAFGAMYSLSELTMKKPALVSSVDGVGTKTLVAIAMGKHRGIGKDIVNHSIDDILTCGAKPLFFLDYFACGKQDDQVVLELIEGMTEACKESGTALIGGETAQMPDVYQPQDYDIAGTIVGVVDEEDIIDGHNILPGDIIIGLPADSLHTNGYTLARKVLQEEMGLNLNETPDGLSNSLGDELLIPHRSYLHDVEKVMDQLTLKGIAHITGGGFEGNIIRILPDGTSAKIDTKTWNPLMIFKLIQQGGKISNDEMYRVFNMGIGMTLIVSPSDKDAVLEAIEGSCQIGEITQGEGVEMIF